MLMMNEKIVTSGNGPEFILDPGGLIRIMGKWMKGTDKESIMPVFNWIDEYLVNPAGTTCIDVHLEYLYGNELPHLLNMIRRLLILRERNLELIVNWYYEEGDEDMLEQGEYTSSLVGIPFGFVLISDNRGGI